jgi:pimeloyl-ACP methyl ester carboxylesterase
MSFSPIVFFHANGFPSGVYQHFFHEIEAQLHGSMRVLAPDVLDTPDDCPAPERWPYMLKQAIAFVDSVPGNHVVLVGHSMGGYLSLQVAAARPKRVKQVVLIDSPLATGWKLAFLSVARSTGLAYKGGPAPIAARRRFEWESEQAARELFESKRFVQRWHPGVLSDFLRHGLVRSPDGMVRLRIPRESERDIYAYVASGRALRAYRKLQERSVPVTFIGGKHSRELRMVGHAATRNMFGTSFIEIDAGHLMPFEKPHATARAVIKALV